MLAGQYLLLATLCFTHTALADIRCFCNAPECDQNTNTCLSRSEKCFSKFKTVVENNNTIPREEHGCIDMQPEAERSSCDGNGDYVRQIKAQDVLMCCSDNLCNYRPNQDINVDIVDPQAQEVTNNYPSERVEIDDGEPSSKEDIWFKAAVIAVPIAGGLILIVLILMAIRLLKDDHRHSHSDRQSSLAKTQGFIENHFIKDSSIKSQFAQQHKPRNDKKSTKKSIYKDIIIQVGQEKFPNHHLDDCDDKSSSLLMWNEEKRLSLHSVV